jgi:CubicO group peptidase (beta-lactamase class C family)
MTRDQLTPAQREGTEIFLGDYSSWGLGVAVDTVPVEPWNVPGRFGWVGGLGTSAYSDPTNDFIGAVFTQRVMDSPEAGAVFTDFWKHAYRTFEA